MRTLKLMLYVTAFTSALACGNANTAAASETTGKTTIYLQQNNNESKTDFIKKLYSEYVFGGEDFSPIAHKYCTQKLRKNLSDAYEYDCYDNECYAVWMFRSGFQDGPNDVCRLTGITEQENGWYLINFIEMGNEASVRIRFIDCNGSFKMDEIENENYM